MRNGGFDAYAKKKKRGGFDVGRLILNVGILFQGETDLWSGSKRADFNCHCY